MATTAVLATEAEARARAASIRDQLREMEQLAERIAPLLAEAKEREDWRAFRDPVTGRPLYNSWAAYIEGEFPFSRQRSYQLLDQLKVNQELSEAAGVPVELPERNTREIRKSPELRTPIVADVKAGLTPSAAYLRAVEAQRATEKIWATDPKLGGKKHKGYHGPLERLRDMREQISDNRDEISPDLMRELEQWYNLLADILGLGDEPAASAPAKSLDALMASGLVTRGVPQSVE